MPTASNQCYISCPDLLSPSIDQLRKDNFSVAKLKTKWSDSEKQCLAIGLRSWKNDEMMAVYGSDAKNDDPWRWISRYPLNNQRTPREVKNAVRKLKANVAF